MDHQKPDKFFIDSFFGMIQKRNWFEICVAFDDPSWLGGGGYAQIFFWEEGREDDCQRLMSLEGVVPFGGKARDKFSCSFREEVFLVEKEQKNSSLASPPKGTIPFKLINP
uniref:Uncharacterized protein n=1 Tax=Panagrolaimus sp. JU765 TaxID=591449 RepID=A0AC34RC15_9BILA